MDAKSQFLGVKIARSRKLTGRFAEEAPRHCRGIGNQGSFEKSKIVDPHKDAHLRQKMEA
jgi:hypothetical protein